MAIPQKCLLLIVCLHTLAGVAQVLLVNKKYLHAFHCGFV